MIAERITRPLSQRFTKRINREPSRLLAHGVPWVSIMLATLVPSWPLIASAPLMPPFAFMLLIAWRQVRPGLLPVWAGMPLGLFDDLYSGQPFGSAMLLWSLTMVVLDLIDARFPWLSFVFDWLVSAGLICAYLILSLSFANAAGGSTQLQVIVPQAVIAICIFPLSGRLVALFDRFRLIPFVDID